MSMKKLLITESTKTQITHHIKCAETVFHCQT